ncbi:hypothetical protein MERGE_002046 [Pneumocystis wakefieldiae]|uniref:Uncharacterized protein n=1 Tax=Pneumocystis wakefieldiae TaxID=38082 RepID=A0A899FWS2_9ASCO|nr:hypothetical protein MERGE_002046 [Pneumocystis wakefieldiae]
MRIVETGASLSNNYIADVLKNHYELELIELTYFIILEFRRFSFNNSLVSLIKTFKLDETSENKKHVILNKLASEYSTTMLCSYESEITKKI